jgi:cytochrome c-type biogenesis protein CcmH
MLFWIIVSVVTAVLAVALIAPLMRRPPSVEGEKSHDVEVYRDQLKEVDRDLAQGLISAEQAEYARAEISRRLIASAEKDATAPAAAKPAGKHPFAQAFVLCLLPAIAVGLYLLTGSPGLPDQPLEARLKNPGKDVGLLLAQAENHLIQHPDDGAGWDLVAPIYLRNQRPDDAAEAYRNAIRILGPTAPRLSGLGESVVASNRGMITSEAKDSFSKALTLDKNDARSEFYLAVALEQEGRAMEALAAFQSLAKTSAPDAPWQNIVAQHIAQLQKGPPPAANPDAPGNPSAADVAAAQNMNAGDRQQMIMGMVAGLDEKLKSNPNNFEGWMRLVRSYAMLQQKDKAADALKRALVTFPAAGAEGQQLVGLAQSLGIDTAGAKP